MADRSLMAPLAYAGTRNVVVEMPDGTVQPVQGVPERVSDQEVAAKFGGRVMGVIEDLLRSAGSGIPFGLGQAISALPKAVAAGGRTLGIVGPDSGAWNMAKDVVGSIEGAAGAAGGNYSPRTKPGEYAKSATASAIPLPFMGNPLVQAGLGASSGVLGQAAADAGLGQAGSVGAEMLPYLLAAGASAARSRHPVTQTRNALENMSPEQTATMQANLQAAKANNVPMMAWQAAPAGSEVRNLGQAVVSSPGSYPIRRVQSEQARLITGDRDLVPPTQSLSTRVASPLYEASAMQPVSPSQAQAVHDAILQVKVDKKLAATSPQSAALDKIARQFGSTVEVPLADTVARLQQQIASLKPNDPARVPLQREIVARIQGQIPPETRFQPAVSNMGELQNVYQNPKLPSELGPIDVDKATKLWARDAIERGINNPQFDAARAKWKETKGLERIAEDTNARNRQVGINPSGAARTEVLPEIMYAGATTPLWAAVPLVRELGQRRIVNAYNKAFTASDIAELQRLANQRPIGTAAQMLGLGALAPFRAGEIPFPQEQ